MAESESSASSRKKDATSRAIDYLRKRSPRRVWWSAARIAVGRGHAGKPLRSPRGHRATGKRV